MYKKEFNGKIITTNLGQHYAINTKQDSKTMVLRIPQDIHETDIQMFERLAPYYSRITFYYDTTAIRGYYALFAYCKY